ncbi:MAG: hypothetical protein KF784_08405 [Fimbriimonadaceae bacterium]|nr:hypothetical protein [Fimbriimonadaceae bacterium]
MKLKWIVLAVSVATVSGMLASDVVAQAKAAPAKAAPKKISLVGISLYDTGATVVAKYGNPFEVQAVSLGGGAIGPAGGPGGGRGPSIGTAGPGGSAPNAAIGREDMRPGGFFDNELFRQGAAIGDEGNGFNIPSGRGGPPVGGAPGSGGAAGGDANSDRILYTRWIYKVGNSKYAFVFDNSNKVVQIEAVGMSDSRVKTAAGVGFGAKFADLIKKYGAPEGYEMNGDAIVVRYLKTHKVVFRLNRLGKDKPHVVTAVVVAGGKA